MRKSEAMLTVALLGTAAMSAWLWSELRAERARSTELGARMTAALPPIATPEPASPLAVPAMPALPAPVTSTPVAVSAAPSPSADAMSAQEDEQAKQRRLLQNPKYRDAWRQQQRLNYTPRRENLIHLLGLSSEQADAVVDLDVDRQIGWIENPPGTLEMQEAEERDHQARLLALLGEEKRAQLQAYMESRGTRMQVDRFRTQMTGVDSLRDDQVEPLIAALQVENVQMRKEIEEYRESHANDNGADTSQRYSDQAIEKMKEAHARMHSAAAPILTSSQLAKLDALLQRELARLEASARMARMQSSLAE